jgi:replication fork clamp-binding protein CrfC
VRGRTWYQGNSFHNAVIVRNASSFAKFLPRLVLRFARIPAMMGGVVVGGYAWIHYQATQAGNYAWGVVSDASGAVFEKASTFYGGVKDVADQTMIGWENTKNKMEMPSWAQQMIDMASTVGRGSDPGGDQGDGNGNGGKAKEARAPAVVGAGAAAASYSTTSKDDEGSPTGAQDDQMMVLTKKMIEIRNILQRIGQSNTLSLPSIVVIGSQSSGKSSVLEALVGHEFLPKGSNMVTRRPIELTLVNTPDSTAEYGEFPDLGLRRVTDFVMIQKTLTELNLAVSETECVSDDPIHLTIYSPNVPDLSLIDLPGYIQVVSHNQPMELKQKITELCDKYIQAPNVILAISAADVDLANSAALRASRRVDPRGERTIGVVTKMDLIEASRGAAILTDKQYPLRLGYVGVVAKAPAQSLFKKGPSDLMSAIVKNEETYFSSHAAEYGPDSGISVGTQTLRKKLMHVLEQTMSASLQGTSDAIKQELEEAAYEFKVQYNDRPLSAESYLAESLDAFKHSFKQFAEEFGRPEMHHLLKTELDQRVLDLLAARYWNKPISDLAAVAPEPDSLADLPKADPESIYWRRQLDASTSALTKLGLGRLATTVVANSIQTHVESLIGQSTFANHPYAQKVITDAASTILNERFYSTSDQVENCIKPFKFDIDIEEREWLQGREHVGGILKKELVDCETALQQLEGQIGGRRKLKEVMGFIDKARKGDVEVEGENRSGAGGFSAALLTRGRISYRRASREYVLTQRNSGREAVFLRDRADIIKMRMMAIKSKQCSNLKNKYYCPEVFLDAVATKLAATSVLFLNVELLSEFYYNFPRELDLRLGRHLSDEEVERFAKEDPKIRRHLEVIRRKELLQLVLEKMDSLRQLESRDRDRSKKNGARQIKENQERGRWGLF